MATRKKKELTETKDWSWPKIEKGSHLTVITHEDGRTELIWDDEQLLKEVREATVTEKSEPAKKSRKKKTA